MQFSRSVVYKFSQSHGLQHTRLPCSSSTLGACSNPCPLGWWCHPIVSSSVVPFFSCHQSIPALGAFPMSKFFASGGQSIRVSASESVLLMNIQDWFPLGLTGLTLNNQQVTEAIKREIKRFLETNDNENTTTQNLWEAAKAVLRAKFKAIQSYLKKQENHRIDNLPLHLKQRGKKKKKKNNNNNNKKTKIVEGKKL